MTTETTAARPIMRSGDAARWIDPFPGERVAIHVGGDDTAGAFMVGEAILDADVGPPMHIHHDADEMLYVLEGAVDFALAGERFRTGPGGFVLIPRGTPHAFRNFGPARARLLGVISPPGLEGFFAAMNGRPPADFPTIAAQFALEVVGPPLTPIDA